MEVEITLWPEWNLISLPLIPENNNIADVLADVLDNVDSVQYYNTSSGSWSWYIPGNPASNLATIDDGLGYWFYMDSSDTLTARGFEKPLPGEPWPAYDVFADDWNMIGFKSTISMNPETYLASIDGDYSFIQTYNATDGTWPWYIPGNPASTLTTMEPGYGYWLWATADGTIIPPDGGSGSKSASDGDGATLPDKADLPTFPPQVPPYGPNPPLPPSSYTSEAE